MAIGLRRDSNEWTKLSIIYGFSERKEKSNGWKDIDNIWWTKSEADRQTEGWLSCRRRSGSRIMGGWRLANGPPRASNIRWEISR